MNGKENIEFARDILDIYIKFVDSCREEENEPLPLSYAIHYISDAVSGTTVTSLADTDMLITVSEILHRAVLFLYSPLTNNTVTKTVVDNEPAIPFNDFARSLRKHFNDILNSSQLVAPSIFKCITLATELECVRRYCDDDTELKTLKLNKGNVEELIESIKDKFCISRAKYSEQEAKDIVNKVYVDLETGVPILEGYFNMINKFNEVLDRIKADILKRIKNDDVPALVFLMDLNTELMKYEQECTKDIDFDVDDSELYRNLLIFEDFESLLLERMGKLFEGYIKDKTDNTTTEEDDEKAEVHIDKEEVQKLYSDTVDDFLANYIAKNGEDSLDYLPVITNFFDIIENFYVKDYAVLDLDRLQAVIFGTEKIIHSLYAYYRAVNPLTAEDINEVFTHSDYYWMNRYKQEMLEWVYDNCISDEQRDKYNSIEDFEKALMTKKDDVVLSSGTTFEFHSFFIDKNKREHISVGIATRLCKTCEILNKLYSRNKHNHTKYNYTNNANTISFFKFYSKIPMVYRNVCLNDDQNATVDAMAEAVREGLGALFNPQFNKNIKQNKEPLKLDLKTPKEIKEELDKSVIGQEKAKKVISVGIYNHYKRIKAENTTIKKSNIMMVGSTGCGKTEIARTVAEILNVPFVITDATSLTEAGYVGEDVENILLKLINACDGDIDKAEHGIVYIDEIDKIARSGGVGKDVGGEGVQQSLLKIIEGAKVEIPIRGKMGQKESLEIDTSNILFICGGAFEGLTMKEKVEKVSMGFNSVPQEDDTPDTIDSKVIVKSGLLPELVGRFPIIVKLETLTEKELKRILVEPKNSVVKQYKDLLDLDNVELEFTDAALGWVAKKAYDLKTGARSLKTILEDSMLDLMYELPSNKEVVKVKVGLKNNKLSFSKSKIKAE